MSIYNVNAKPFDPHLPIKQDMGTQTGPEPRITKACSCKCMHSETYQIPKGFNLSEATLWDQLRPSKTQIRISSTLCVGEPEGLSFVRHQMINHKFKLTKEVITENNYFIKTVPIETTHPEFEDFRIYYRKGRSMPYKIYIRGKNLTTIEEYDLEDNCKTIVRNRMSNERNRSYKQTFNYKKKERKLEVFNMETHELIHTEVLLGEFWLEDSFKYRG
jgi:hypothetical protein